MLAQLWIGSSKLHILFVTLAVQVECTLTQRAHRTTGVHRTEHPADGRWSKVIHFSPGSTNSTPLALSRSPKYACERGSLSRTSLDSKSDSAAFSRDIRQRDGGRCVVSSSPVSLKAFRPRCNRIFASSGFIQLALLAVCSQSFWYSRVQRVSPTSDSLFILSKRIKMIPTTNTQTVMRSTLSRHGL
jgi:hypothetical protein